MGLHGTLLGVSPNISMYGDNRISFSNCASHRFNKEVDMSSKDPIASDTLCELFFDLLARGDLYCRNPGHLVKVGNQGISQMTAYTAWLKWATRFARIPNDLAAHQC